MEYTIDAQGKSIGRTATEAATLLMGKNSPDFKKHIVKEVAVHIVNASRASVHPKKMKNKLFKSYSGYPGGLKEKPMSAVIKEKGYEEVFKKAIYGMLPSNRLRSIRMKNLTITD